MAIASPSTETDICNMALGRIGEKTVTSAQITANTEPRAIQCNLHYAQSRDALLRSGLWRFARARDELTANDTSPDFEWDYAFDLPTDFLRLISVFSDNSALGQNTLFSYKLEGKQLLTDESTCYLRYIKKVTTVTDFEPLFIECLVLQLALKMVPAIAGVGSSGQILAREIRDELYGSPRKPGLMSRVKALDRQETNTIGRSDRPLWNNARWSLDGRIDSKMGS
jgi:hypothetical protein